MIIDQYEELAKLAKTHVCAEHPDLDLTVAWFENHHYVLRCGAGHFPDQLQKLLSYYERYFKGEALPLHIVQNIERRKRG